MAIASVVALVVVMAACVFDLRTRRIPNELTFGAALVGIAFHAVNGHVDGLLVALAGWFTGIAIFLPFYLLRGLGAGDVKLLAAVGAWLGPTMAMWTGLWGAVAGGVLALVVALTRGYLRQALLNLWLLLTHWRAVGIKPLPAVSLDTDRTPRLAYAVPVAVGLVVALWLR